MRPVVCMITSRRDLGRDWQDELIARVLAAAKAGVHLVQIRERDLDGGPLVSLVRRCVEAVRATRSRILVNDRVDVALAAPAHGVHLPANAISATCVRHLAGSHFLVGRSVHSIAEVKRAVGEGGLDYLVFGTVFPSSSKPGVEPAGARALSGAVASSTIPVLGVGGVTPANVATVARAGAAGFAAISMFLETPIDAIAATVSEAAAVFEATGPAPNMDRHDSR